MPDHWRAAVIALVVSILAVLGLYWSTAASMGAVWYRSNTFSHGFLVVPISLYLIWIRRGRLSARTPVANLWGLLFQAIFVFVWLLGRIADVLVVQHFALVGMLVGLVWLVTGTTVIRALLFPLAFLFFAVPVGYSLVPPLQDFTAFFLVKGLDFSGIPVVLEGRILHIPSARWEVAEACSGVRYVIPAVVLGSLYASLIYRSWGRRLGFMLASVLVPIMANAVRAYGIVMLAHFTDNRIAIGTDHLIYGWLFFGVVIGLLFWAGLRWRESSGQPPLPGAEPSQAFANQAALAAGSGTRRGFSARAAVLVATAGVLLAALGPVGANAAASRGETTISIRPPLLVVATPWEGGAESPENWKPRFLAADAELMRHYTSGPQRVDLYIAYYASQRSGKELVTSQNTLFDEKRWAWVAEGARQAVVDGQPLSLHQTVLRSGQVTRLVWSWYWIAGEFVSSPYRAKLLRAKAGLLGGSQEAALIAVAADYDGYHPEYAVDAIQEFLHHASLRESLMSYSEP